MVAGFDLRHHVAEARDATGYVPQRFSLYTDLTPAENLEFFSEVYGMPRAKRVARAKELLDFVGLTAFANRRSEFLSGGMKQKLSLACALIHRPRVLLLDEPTGGVDPVARQEFWRLLLHAAGGRLGHAHQHAVHGRGDPLPPRGVDESRAS